MEGREGEGRVFSFCETERRGGREGVMKGRRVEERASQAMDSVLEVSGRREGEVGRT